ncbi:unnamed protein product [Caenorhabditis angaria]|uniref:Uncharacterized protein n=1 Tax=Caenorhabditis angaria TaxID=860376 RepID=A0A9P1ILD3_9PELO|nr:unnamed protein product [Caenorhabditis angaria]
MVIGGHGDSAPIMVNWCDWCSWRNFNHLWNWRMVDGRIGEWCNSPIGVVGAISPIGVVGAISPIGVVGAISPIGVVGAISPIGVVGAISPIGAIGAPMTKYTNHTNWRIPPSPFANSTIHQFNKFHQWLKLRQLHQSHQFTIIGAIGVIGALSPCPPITIQSPSNIHHLSQHLNHITKPLLTMSKLTIGVESSRKNHSTRLESFSNRLTFSTKRLESLVESKTAVLSTPSRLEST